MGGWGCGCGCGSQMRFSIYGVQCSVIPVSKHKPGGIDVHLRVDTDLTSGSECSSTIGNRGKTVDDICMTVNC